MIYLKEPVDARVEQQVAELTKQGMRKVREVRRHLAQFVTAELFKGASPPPPSRRRYYPSEKDLRNMMAKVKDQTRHRIDQVNLEVRGAVVIPLLWVNSWWEKNDCICCRPRLKTGVLLHQGTCSTCASTLRRSPFSSAIRLCGR